MSGTVRRFVVIFDDSRIGRHHDISPLSIDVDADTPRPADVIAEYVHRFAGRFLASSDYVVNVDLTRGFGSIGFGRYGTFRISLVVAS